MSKNRSEIIGKILLYSAVANTFLLALTVVPKLNTKVDCDERIDKCLCALRKYIILSILWTAVFCYFMNKKYGTFAILTTVSVNILMIVWASVSYWCVVKRCTNNIQNGMYRSPETPSQAPPMLTTIPEGANNGVGNYVAITENSSPFINPSKPMDLPHNIQSCAVDGNNLCT